jgi:hypothetical protein
MLVLHPKGLFAGKQVPEQDKIACQTKHGILEGSRFILFKEQMAYPGETIADEGDGKKELIVMEKHGSDEQKDHQASANEMQDTAG